MTGFGRVSDNDKKAHSFDTPHFQSTLRRILRVFPIFCFFTSSEYATIYAFDQFMAKNYFKECLLGVIPTYLCVASAKSPNSKDNS